MRPWLLAALAATLPACATQASAALTKPVPEVEQQESSTQAVSGIEDGHAGALGGAGTHVGKTDSGPSSHSAASSAGGSASSGAGSGGDGAPVVKITHLNVFPNIPALPEHQLAHGILRIGGPGIGWSVGLLSYDDKEMPQGGMGQSGKCALTQSPRAFSDNQCQWHVWVSATPGGAPLSKKCYWFSSNLNDASIGGGNWYTPHTGAIAAEAAKNWGYLCELPKQHTRYWCNYTATGWDAASPPKKCDAVLVFPASLMPEDLYPDSLVK